MHGRRMYVPNACISLSFSLSHKIKIKIAFSLSFFLMESRLENADGHCSEGNLVQKSEHGTPMTMLQRLAMLISAKTQRFATVLTLHAVAKTTFMNMILLMAATVMVLTFKSLDVLQIFLYITRQTVKVGPRYYARAARPKGLLSPLHDRLYWLQMPHIYFLLFLNIAIFGFG